MQYGKKYICGPVSPGHVEKGNSEVAIRNH